MDTRSSSTSSSSASCFDSACMRTVMPVLTRPDVGSISPVMSFSIVDLPAPFSPRMPVRSPGPMFQSMSRWTSLASSP